MSRKQLETRVPYHYVQNLLITNIVLGRFDKEAHSKFRQIGSLNIAARALNGC